MSIFKKAENHMAYLKTGILGFAGSGKTTTAAYLAIGFIQYMREHNVETATKPVYFLDTETGSDWMIPKFKEAGIELLVAKTRAFKDLAAAVKEVEQSGSILIVDSITHFWKDCVDSYCKRRSINRLGFHHWKDIKDTWNMGFAEPFVNSNAHLITCGRAGYEYDYFEDDGKKELEKTGIKMKAESEFGFEPSLLIYMDRKQDMETHKIYRIAEIWKDRSDRIDGKTFRNPTFNDFMPHIEYLNLGGEHYGVGTEDSQDMFDRNGKTQWQRDIEEKEMVLEETQNILVKHYPSTSGAEKKAKLELLQQHFGTSSWKRIESNQYPLMRVKECYNALHLELEGVPAYPEPAPDLPADFDEDIPLDLQKKA